MKDSDEAPISSYLGNDYKKDKKRSCCIGFKTNLTEFICCIKIWTGKVLPKEDTMMVDGDNPGEEYLDTLKDEDHQKYKMLIGILNRIVCIGWMDVAFTNVSLSCFTM